MTGAVTPRPTGTPLPIGPEKCRSAPVLLPQAGHALPLASLDRRLAPEAPPGALCGLLRRWRSRGLCGGRGFELGDAAGERGDDPPVLPVALVRLVQLLPEVEHLIAQILDED